MKNAFVNAPLKRPIYVSSSDGFARVVQEDCNCVLRKALYGLRPSSRGWYFSLHKFLGEYGFGQSKADPALYVWNSEGVLVIIVVYVDYIMRLDDSNSSLDRVAEHFNKSLKFV